MLTCYVRYFKIYSLLPEIFCNSHVFINIIPFTIVEVTEKPNDETKLRCIYLWSHTFQIPYLCQTTWRATAEGRGGAGKRHSLLSPQ